MKDTVKYEFHHFGIPLQDGKEEGVFSEKAGMYTVDNPGKFRVQWHRFTDNSPLHPLLKTVPHVAFKVDNLEDAIRGEEIILGPYEPIDDYFVAVINDCGVPIELIQTTLSDDELWGRARTGQGSLYRK
ncbi:VOC family protein [Buttiauxella noackiae]